MSHFTVLVVGEDIETQLSSYEESPKGKNFLVFEDTEDESLKKYQTESRKEFYCSSSSSWGQEVTPDFMVECDKHKLEEEFNFTVKDKTSGFGGYWKQDGYYQCGVQVNHEHPERQIWVKVVDIVKTNHPDKDVCFEGVIRIKKVADPKEIKFTDFYPTFEKYMEDWSGHEKRDVEHNRYGSWSNPNAKWDYWRIGGRWAGHFTLKSESKLAYAGQSPNFGYEWDNDSKGREERKEKADSAKKIDIDFELMMKETAEKAAKQYDMVQELILKDLPVNESWEVICEKHKGNHKHARDIFWAQPRCKAWQEFNKTNTSPDTEFIKWADFEEFTLTDRETFIQKRAKQSYQTFAILKDGVWYEKGKMGWFACVADEKKDWIETFDSILATVKDDELITVVDCHI